MGAQDYPEEYRRWRHIRAAEPDSALPGGETLTAFAQRSAAAAEVAADRYW